MMPQAVQHDSCADFLVCKKRREEGKSMKIECSSVNCCFTSAPDFILKLGGNTNLRCPFQSLRLCFDQVDTESFKRLYHGLFVRRPLMIKTLVSKLPICLITCCMNGPVYFDIMQLIVVNSVYNE